MTAPDMFLCDEDNAVLEAIRKRLADPLSEDALRAALPHLQPTVPNTVDALDAAMPERDGRYQGDDGEWAVRHRKTRIIRAMRDRGDAENEARLNPDVEVVRRTVTAWRAPRDILGDARRCATRPARPRRPQ